MKSFITLFNRANGRNELFHKPEDYSAFEWIMIWPFDAPADWIDWGNRAQTAGELDALRKPLWLRTLDDADREYAGVEIYSSSTR